MKVYHIYSTFLPTTSGGVEKHIMTLSKEMARRGHEILLLLPRRDFLPKYETQDKYLKILRLGSGISTALSSKRIVGTTLDFFSNNLDFLFRAWIWLRKDDARKIDLLHTHSDGLFCYSLKNGCKLSKWTKRPLIISLHQKIGTKIGDLPAKSKLFEKYFKNAERIIVHRKQNLRYLCRWGYEEKAVFIPIPIDIQKFRRPDNSNISSTNIIRILWIGRLNKRKDPLTLIKAFLFVHSVYKNTELHIVGYGKLESQIKELIRNNTELSKAILFHGKKFDVRKYLWNSNIYVSLNISDNYPSLSLREAMAAGLAPIVTDVGETKELIHNGVNGLLVPPLNPAAVSRAIITLIEDEKFRNRLSTNAKFSSESFNISGLIQRYIKTYFEAIGK